MRKKSIRLLVHHLHYFINAGAVRMVHLRESLWQEVSPGMLMAWQITLLKYYRITVPTRQHSTTKLPKAVEKGHLHPICTYRASIALVKA